MAKAAQTSVEIVANAKSPAQVAINAYFKNNEISDWGQIPIWEKLTLLQNTPDVFRKTREVSGKKIPYVSHLFCEKALNFVFNFNVSCELIGEPKFETYKIMVNDWKNGQVVGKKETTAYECILTMKFTFSDGPREITRTVISGHKSFENPATTKADCLKSAMSKAWTVVARTFGIGADIAPQEEKAYADIEKAEVKVKEKPQAQQPNVEKSFTPPAPKEPTLDKPPY